MDSCELTYDSGKRKIYFFGCTSGICLLCILVLPGISAVFVFILIFAAIGFAATIFSYRQILLYTDRMTVVNIFGTLQMEVSFDEIKRVGFVHGGGTFGRNAFREDVSSDILVFILTNNDSLQLDGNDFDDIHSVCSYIQQKVNTK